MNSGQNQLQEEDLLGCPELMLDTHTPHAPAVLHASTNSEVPQDTFSHQLPFRIITYNQNGRNFRDYDHRKQLDWMRDDSSTNTIHVFASQECETSLARSYVSESKPQFEKTLNALFAETHYSLLKPAVMMGMHLAVILPNSLISSVERMEMHKVSLSLFGNKGAVAIALTIMHKSILIINAHLSPHDDQSRRRVKEYHTIMQQLAEKLVPIDLDVDPHSYTCTEALTSYFDCIFFCGDLNFRLEGSRSQVDHLLKHFPQSRRKLIALDQLKRIQQRGEAFECFQEGEITFQPTFKLDPFTDSYDSSSKMRVPSYTDRILYYSNVKRGNTILVRNYSSCTQCSFIGSDHRPVIGEYVLRWESCE